IREPQVQVVNNCIVDNAISLNKLVRLYITKEGSCEMMSKILKKDRTKSTKIISMATSKTTNEYTYTQKINTLWFLVSLLVFHYFKQRAKQNIQRHLLHSTP
ncbi:hypothetical protein PAEPH01_1154, partial [Pancytospora epiphaga]